MNPKSAKLIILLCLLVLRLSSQDTDPYYIQYSITDGLPSSEVYDLEIDSLNQIWITTDRGVCTYDGYDFKTYTTEDGLADNTNFEIYKDKKNRLWFTGYNQTLSIYKNGKFFPYKFNNKISEFKGEWISDIIDCKENGLFFSTNKNEQTNLYRYDEDTPPSKIDFKLCVDSLEYLAISGRNNFELEDLNASFYKLKGVKLSPVNVNFSLDFNTHWIYANNQNIYKKNKSNNTIEITQLEHSIEKLYIDKQDNLWACTLDGLFCFSGSDISLPPKLYFNDFSISSIIQDFEGNYWLSSNESGILQVPSFEITTIQKSQDNSALLNYLSIGTLDNHIIFGTSNSSLIAVNNNLKKKNIPFPKLDYDFQINHIDRSNSKNQVYIGQNTYINEVDGELHIKYDFPVYKVNKRIFTLNNGDQFTFVHTGFIVFHQDGIKKDTSVLFKNPFLEKITAIAQDHKDNIWIGTLNGMYVIKNHKYREVSEVLYKDQAFQRISDIKIDHKDHLWICTLGSGIFYKTRNETKRISSLDGLSSNMTNQILLSNDSTVWLANNKGINAFNYSYSKPRLKLSSIKSINDFDGLISNYVNAIAYWEDKIWAATNEGVCYFDPKIIQNKYPEVPVIINQFIVNDSSYLSDQKIEFQHFQNDVFIEYTGIRYRKNKENSFYKYRLINSDSKNKEEWFTTNEKNIRYNDLNPGKYQFEITAKNKNGIWNTKPEVLSFIIKPHYTDTSWFKLLAILCLIVLIASLMYYQLKRYQTSALKEKELKEVELKSQAFELASLRNQMNPHFVFNSLNAIQNFIFKNDVPNANYYLTKFSSLMRDSLQYTRLDFISLTKEISFLKNYLELETMRFPNKFKYVISVNKNLDIDAIQIPPLLLQPIIENSVKHAFKNITYKGLIKIEIEELSKDLIQIQLSDNGSGIKEKTDPKPKIKVNHKSLGLEIVKSRIELMNKSHFENKAFLKFENLSLGDKGYSVLIYLPIRYA